jgi:tight adherence protein B
MNTNVLFLSGLATLAAGGVFYAVVYPYLSGDIKAEKRQAALSSTAGRRAGGDRSLDKDNRRKQIAESLKELESRSKSKRLTLDARLAQAGLDWTRQRYYIFSAVMGGVFGALLFFLSANRLLIVPAAAIGAFGFPAWLLGYLRKRRMNKFILEFPNAIDVIVRGIKAGLPLGDCLRIISSEASEPVRSEFRNIVEAQAMGLGLGEAVDRIVERVPVAEAKFFSIVINIQQKAGGNLSETLGNLSKVLRDRKRMRVKINAMSMEAKSSAGIIGALPFVVAFMVYLTSPTYIELLWKTHAGQMALVGCGFWMSVGVMMMRKMINFDI